MSILRGIYWPGFIFFMGIFSMIIGTIIYFGLKDD